MPRHFVSRMSTRSVRFAEYGVSPSGWLPPVRNDPAAILGFGKSIASWYESLLMLYKLGRVLQFAGLVILPVAIAGDMAGKVEFKQSLAMSFVGILVFFAGWLLQQGTRPR